MRVWVIIRTPVILHFPLHIGPVPGSALNYEFVCAIFSARSRASYDRWPGRSDAKFGRGLSFRGVLGTLGVSVLFPLASAWRGPTATVFGRGGRSAVGCGLGLCYPLPGRPVLPLRDGRNQWEAPVARRETGLTELHLFRTSVGLPSRERWVTERCCEPFLRFLLFGRGRPRGSVWS